LSAEKHLVSEKRGRKGAKGKWTYNKKETNRGLFQRKPGEEAKACKGITGEDTGS